MGFKQEIRRFIEENKLAHALFGKSLEYRTNKILQRNIKQYGLECLLLVQETFKEYNQEFWLDYGTLLGAVREKDFISHDLDMDIGTFNMSEEKKRALEKALNDKGVELSRKFTVDGHIVEQTFTYKGTHIDIFYYYSEDPNKVWCYFFEGTEDMSTKEIGNQKIMTGWNAKTVSSTLLGTKLMPFKGEEFPVPSNVEEYLIENYGPNYMIKDENWDFANSASNIKVVSANNVEAIYK
ncbi:LicD family protein [Bacillus sp. 8YEL33]|uniref:LicD family protein n=1 Tax=Bacillus TaxID=1386 RepID=UPI000BF1BE0E|nr:MULTISPECIES: LicD family protein [Bacillus]MBY7129357.1 LicD family protein [Bacillus sp. 8YEL33]PEK30727.1 LuxR family transcriptional regulator [Bacillus toyonensis]PEL73456.1 LuxR family transcriptional regulator [Bacillus toyonensis]